MRWVGRLIFFLLMLIVQRGALLGQACSTLGQNPGSAFPVCGTFAFTQTTVPTCGGTKLPTPCGGTAAYSDINPYWYKFTCYKTGSFAFQIVPKNLGDDYDWQLFDITGHNPMDIYSDASLIVSANWSGSPGTTGTSSSAKNPFECASDPRAGVSTFSTLPTITAGHDYLLLISHFDGLSQSGYDLSFPTGSQPGAGTASIVDPLVPAMKSVYGVCDGSEIVVVLNKKVKCASLAADGTDFSVAGPVPINVASAIANSCSGSFDMDTVRLKLDHIMSPGRYTITAKVGTDGNSLIDNCSNQMQGQQASINFVPAVPTPMDSIAPVTCIKDTLQLVFSKPIMCNSISADGSEFIVNGPVPVTVKSANGVCTNGFATSINILLTAPIRTNGTFTITLKNGSDGNTLIDECSEVTPAGSTLSFTTKNITTADFQANVVPGCKYDTLRLTHNGYGGTTQWQWLIDSAAFSTVQNPVLISRAFGTYRASLSVSNGSCTDTSSQPFTLPDLTVRAGFIVGDTLCPTEQIQFTDNSSSNTTNWSWKFSNGNTSNSQTPPTQSYPSTGRPMEYLVSLNASNSVCSDVYYKIITIVASCYIAVPSAFTPNGDGINDYLYPLNAVDVDNLLFRVYNRYGQLIFESKTYSKKWDGTYKGQPQPSGTYIWTFSYNKRGSSERIDLKGTAVLIR